MENILYRRASSGSEKAVITMTDYRLISAELLKDYIIEEIKTDNEEIEDFLFTLGCYKGERITIISKVSSSLVVSIKDARYSIDKELANCIIVKA